MLARSETNEFGRHVYASLGLATPADPDMYGYISEQHGYGMTAQESGEQAEDLAATMLASTLGLDFDPEAAWNERKQIYEHSSLIIDSTSITAAAECGPNNHWTCAIAAAVFCFPEFQNSRAPRRRLLHRYEHGVCSSLRPEPARRRRGARQSGSRSRNGWLRAGSRRWLKWGHEDAFLRPMLRACYPFRRYVRGLRPAARPDVQ